MGSVLLLMLLGLMTSVNSIRQTSMRGTRRSTDECEKRCGGKYKGSDSKLMLSTKQRPSKSTQFTWEMNHPFNISHKPEDDIQDCDPCYDRLHKEKNLTLNIVKDTFVVASDCANRARCTLPAGMIIKKSGIPGAGLGVWVEKLFPNGAFFGPYEGDTYYNSDDKTIDSAYAWIVCCKKENYSAKFLIDGSNVRRSNWMRYINCARNVHEQNLDVFIYKGKVYYESNRDIHPGEELLIFYGYAYAHDLGIHMNTYYL